MHSSKFSDIGRCLSRNKNKQKKHKIRNESPHKCMTNNIQQIYLLYFTDHTHTHTHTHTRTYTSGHVMQRAALGICWLSQGSGIICQNSLIFTQLSFLCAWASGLSTVERGGESRSSAGRDGSSVLNRQAHIFISTKPCLNRCHKSIFTRDDLFMQMAPNCSSRGIVCLFLVAVLGPARCWLCIYL